MDLSPKESAILLCMSVCAHDGLLSGAEQKKLQELAATHFSVEGGEFNDLLDRFFLETSSIEDLVDKVEGRIAGELILQIAREASSADGLDIRENLALLKAESLFGVKRG